MFDPLKLSEVAKREWQVVKGAPWSFWSMTLVVALVTFGITNFVMELKLSAAQAEAKINKDKLDLATSALVNAQLRMAAMPKGPFGPDGKPMAFITNESNAAIIMRHNYAEGSRLLDNKGRGKALVEDSILRQK